MKAIFLPSKNLPNTHKTYSCGTRSVILSLLTLLAGCQNIPTLSESDAEEKINASFTIAPEWQSGITNTGKKNTDTSIETNNNSGWLLTLNDDRLEQFVQTALNNNPDLRASAANLQASIQNARVTGANLLPQLDLDFNRSRTQTENTDDTSTTPIYTTAYTRSLNVSWEIDIWGKLNASKKAAVLDAETERANYAAAKLALVANVARAWFNLNALKLRLETAELRLDSQQNTLSVIEDNYKSGLDSALEVYLNRTDLAIQESAIIDLQDSLAQATRAFKQLLGEYPSSNIDFESKLPLLDANIPAGLPSDLLKRRPDVLASLRQWQASELNTKAASKARLPSFSLTASYGGSSEELRFLDQRQLLWNLVNNLSLPIFQGGRLDAQAKQAKFLQDASFENYVSVLLNSFTEVENSLNTEQALQKSFNATKNAAFYSESGYQLALDQYQSGLINYTTLLESQRRWFDAQSNLIDLKNDLLQNRIALYLALGGDFASQQSSTTNVNVNKSTKR